MDRLTYSFNIIKKDKIKNKREKKLVLCFPSQIQEDECVSVSDFRLETLLIPNTGSFLRNYHTSVPLPSSQSLDIGTT